MAQQKPVIPATGNRTGGNRPLGRAAAPTARLMASFRGYFARSPIDPQELPRIMRVHIITGCLGTIWGTLIAGIIFTWFGNAIGMTRLTWGVLGGIAAWVVLVQPLGALLAARLGRRKLPWVSLAMTERMLRLAGIVGGYLAWRAGYPFAAFILLATGLVAGLAGCLAAGIWWGWLAAIIPEEVQGAFWGRRDTWISVAVMAAVVPPTLLLDRIPQAVKPAAVLGILVATSIIGFVDILWHGTIPDPPMPAERSRGSLEAVLAPLRDRRFRPWLTFTASWSFSMALGGSLALLYFLENLGLKNNMLGGAIAVNVVALVGSMLSARRMGRLVDRWGPRRVLLVGHIAWSFLPAFWLFARPGTAVLWIGLASLVGGVFSTAAANAGMKLVTRFPPAQQSAMYSAVSNSVASIAGGIGTLLAGILLQALGEWKASVGSLVLSAFPLLFLISFVLRATSAVVLVPRVRERATADEDRPLLLPLFFGLPIKRRRSG